MADGSTEAGKKVHIEVPAERAKAFRKAVIYRLKSAVESGGDADTDSGETSREDCDAVLPYIDLVNEVLECYVAPRGHSVVLDPVAAGYLVDEGYNLTVDMLREQTSAAGARKVADELEFWESLKSRLQEEA